MVVNEKTLVEPVAVVQPATHTTGGARRVVGILLLYYPEYSVHAVSMFSRFLKSVSPNFGILIVTNRNLTIAPHRDVMAVIPGDNALREFSGWNAGLKYGQQNDLIRNCNLMVFANDTFCHHNKFGLLTQAAFRDSFRKIMNEPRTPMMAGEEFFLGKPYALNGLSSKSWICTYLFAWNRAALEYIPSLTPPTAMEIYYSKNNLGEVIFSDLVSENLAKHIVSWLTGSGKTIWRGVGTKGGNGLGSLQGKANSILCEKYLSAVAVSKGVLLVDVFPKKYWKRLRLIESFSEKCRKWLGREGPSA